MKILIDADGCPVRKQVTVLAMAYEVPLVIISNVHHDIVSEYGECVMVDGGSDVADHKIIELLEEGDLVITQDYGLAALVLGKKGFAMHQDGWLFTEDNIDSLLARRHLNQKLRKARKRHPLMKKRKQVDDNHFVKALKVFLDEQRKAV